MVRTVTVMYTFTRLLGIYTKLYIHNYTRLIMHKPSHITWINRQSHIEYYNLADFNEYFSFSPLFERDRSKHTYTYVFSHYKDL